MLSYTVLFVDTEQLILTLARKVLERAGFRIVTASNRAVFQQLDIIQPDLIILNITDRDEINADLLTRLKSRSTTRYIPLILTSAGLFEAPPIFEAAAFFAKPFDWDNLINMVTLLITASPQQPPTKRIC